MEFIIKMTTSLFKILMAVWSIIKTRDFVTAFFATMLGVFIALYLNSLWHQRCLNKVTIQKLYLVYLESQSNARSAKGILDAYSLSDSVNFQLVRLDAEAAKKAFEDKNIRIFLPLYKLSLLQSYMQRLKTLNYVLDTHRGYLECVGYKTTATQKDIREKIRENAASALAQTYLIQQEFKEYFKGQDPSFKRAIDKLDEKFIRIRDKALRGEIELTK